MNIVILSGRLCADPELRTTSSGISIATANLAVDRGYGEKKETDFIKIVMWRNIAENASKYCSKGDKVNLSGELHTREYEAKNGEKRTAYEVYVDKLEFPAKKERSGGAERSVPEDEDLPF